jgi:tetratricopeptide (TPR) repeat protein
LAYLNQDEHGPAIDDFTKAIGLSPDFSILYSNRGFSYYKQDEYNSAIKDYSKAIELDSNDENNYFWRGHSYYLKENYGAAIQDFSKAIKINGDEYLYHELRGQAYKQKENYDSAVTDFTKAIELYLDKDDATAEKLAELYNYRGVAWSYKENKEKAKDDFREAVRIDPSNDTYKKNLDDCFITTAVCGYLGKPDNCYELTAFRDFRDNWLIHQPDGKAIVDEYYLVAPSIVTRIDKSVEKDAVYSDIWNKYLLPCLRFIENGEMENCRVKYIEMVENLKNTWEDEK